MFPEDPILGETTAAEHNSKQLANRMEKPVLSVRPQLYAAMGVRISYPTDSLHIYR